MIFMLPLILFAQTERWVYRYDGYGNWSDWGRSVIYGLDGNIYAVGESNVNSFDFAVIGLSNSGIERWVYTYNGPGNDLDEARSIIYGQDGNLYIAGFISIGSSTSEQDFIVINLDTSGTERWIYQYNGPGSAQDRALSIIYGTDGNLYAAGYSGGNGTLDDFTVVSLTTLGTERWVYRYNGPGNHYDQAYSIVYGRDGNLYAAGRSTDIGTNNTQDFTVISLDTLGIERWVYRYNGPGNWLDAANSIVQGLDGNLYAAGYIAGSGTGKDFTVISLDTSGIERWKYIYNGPGNKDDCASSIIYDSNGNIYIAGERIVSGLYPDFVVISLDTSGTEKWLYSYGTGSWDAGYSIVCGLDGNIYAAGTIGFDFSVISLDTLGTERWVYTYNGPGNGTDKAYSIVYGFDGNLYAAGESWGSTIDFIVISLKPPTGIAEARGKKPEARYGLQIYPNPFSKQTLIHYALSTMHYAPNSIEQSAESKGNTLSTMPLALSLKVYDAIGRLVRSFLLPTAYSLLPTSVEWNGTDDSGRRLPTGIYFCQLQYGEEKEIRKIIMVR
jgi:hypothetical protein